MLSCYTCPVHRAVARTLLIGALLLAVAGCGYNASATFNADGSVTVGLKLLLPTSLMQSGSGTSVQGLSPADIDKANAELKSKYPGANVARVTEGEESGVLITVPFKTEKDAFAFLTQPSKLSPTGVTSAASSAIDLGNTGGLFVSATRTTSGAIDTYTFKTQAQPLASPSPGSQELLTPDELASIFTITFSLTVPREITSASGALFTQDRKTAIWKLSLTQSQTLTATTDSSVAAGSNGGAGQNPALLIGILVAAIGLGFFLGKITPWRLVSHPAAAPAPAPMGFPPPAVGPPAGDPPSTEPSGPSGPPPGVPPPSPPTT